MIPADELARLRELAQRAADDLAQPIQMEQPQREYEEAADPLTMLKLLDALEQVTAIPREPTEAMIDAGPDDLTSDEKCRAWIAMYDAALVRGERKE